MQNTKYIFKSLEGVSLQTITHVFNSGFADYYLKVNVSESDLAIKMKSENILLNYSCGAFYNHSLVGFILIAVNEVNGVQCSYNAGTTVLPQYRGERITAKLYRYLIPKLIFDGIYYHQLEVLRQNTVALNVYSTIGFTKHRNLLCFKGTVLKKRFLSDISISSVSFSEISRLPIEFYKPPACQNSMNILELGSDHHISLAAIVNGEIAGCILFSPKNNRVKLCFVCKQWRRKGIGSILLYEAQKSIGNTEISILNIDEKDNATIDFLSANGLYVYLGQIEMKMKKIN